MDAVFPIPPPARPARFRVSEWAVFVILLAVGALALNSQSFWIDEATTAEIARQHSLAEWWQAMLKDHGSNTQMPIYMIYVWAWEKVWGTGEWAMRTSNLPWL